MDRRLGSQASGLRARCTGATVRPPCTQAAGLPVMSWCRVIRETPRLASEREQDGLLPDLKR